MDERLEADIMNTIPERSSKYFCLFLLRISMQSCKKQPAIVGAMTHGLDLGGAYDATLERIKAQAGERFKLGMAALMWICYSERPLKSEELCHARGVDCPADPLHSPRVSVQLSRPSRWTSLDNCGDLPDLFPAGHGQEPHPFSNIREPTRKWVSRIGQDGLRWNSLASPITTYPLNKFWSPPFAGPRLVELAWSLIGIQYPDLNRRVA